MRKLTSPILRALFRLVWQFRKLPQVLSFTVFFLSELLRANLRVAWAVINPRPVRQCAIVAIPLDCTRDIEILLLSSLITLTPGTLSVDVAPDRKTLYVHAMLVADAEGFIQEVKTTFERRVRELCA